MTTTTSKFSIISNTYIVLTTGNISIRICTKHETHGQNFLRNFRVYYASFQINILHNNLQILDFCNITNSTDKNKLV